MLNFVQLFIIMKSDHISLKFRQNFNLQLSLYIPLHTQYHIQVLLYMFHITLHSSKTEKVVDDKDMFQQFQK